MKTRNGWVSNSSSSSFIISKKGEMNFKVMVEMDFKDCINTTLKTKEEVETYIIDEYCWRDRTIEDVFEDEPYVEEQYKSMIKAIDNNETVYVLSGSSEDYDGAGMYLYHNGLQGFKDINIIEDGE